MPLPFGRCTISWHPRRITSRLWCLLPVGVLPFTPQSVSALESKAVFLSSSQASGEGLHNCSLAFQALDWVADMPRLRRKPEQGRIPEQGRRPEQGRKPEQVSGKGGTLLPGQDTFEQARAMLKMKFPVPEVLKLFEMYVDPQTWSEVVEEMKAEIEANEAGRFR